MSMALVKEYDKHLDSKTRITLCGATVGYYAVQVFDSGPVLLEPRVLTHPANHSPNASSPYDSTIACASRMKKLLQLFQLNGISILGMGSASASLK